MICARTKSQKEVASRKWVRRLQLFVLHADLPGFVSVWNINIMKCMSLSDKTHSCPALCTQLCSSLQNDVHMRVIPYLLVATLVCC